jgi:hypothetical protein
VVDAKEKGPELLRRTGLVERPENVESGDFRELSPPEV